MNPNVMLVVLLFGLAVYFLDPEVPDPFLFPTSGIADLVTDIQPAVVEIQVTRSLPAFSIFSLASFGWFFICSLPSTLLFLSPTPCLPPRSSSTAADSG